MTAVIYLNLNYKMETVRLMLPKMIFMHIVVIFLVW